MENKIRQLREKARLSQQDLARVVGTSQQQIARVESGAQSVKLDLALQIAAALKADLGRVFPGTKKLVGRGKARKSRDQLVEMHYDSDAVRHFESAGVDLDPATWLLTLRMRGGADPKFSVSTADAERLRRNLEQRDPSSPFFVFHSSYVAVAINLDHLLHYQELWDSHVPDDWHDPDVARDEVSVYFSDSATPLRFSAYPDETDLQSDGEIGVLSALLQGLEMFVEPGEFVNFMDEDGEYAFFRASDIALLAIPLRDINPQLNDSLIDAELESESEPQETAESEPTLSDRPASGVTATESADLLTRRANSA